MFEARSVRLFLKEGRSDKIYEAHLSEDGDGWRVDYRNGRRGGALRDGSKVTGATFEEADRIYRKVLSEKMRKGYTPDGTGQAFSGTPREASVTGFRPQLFNEMSDTEARKLGSDWLIQEKHDGERRGASWDGQKPTFSNRRGLEVSVDPAISAAFRRLGEIVGSPLEVDAEDMGDHLVIFDVIRHFMISEGTFRERAAILDKIRKDLSFNGLSDVLKVDVPTPANVFFERHADILRAGGAEGYVGRHASSLYEPGRPSSGGDVFKVKYWAEATCRVAPGREGRSSIGIEMQDGVEGPWVPVGNVTVPAGKELPEIGTLVEVRYLYAMPGGALFQPVLKGPRPDLLPDSAQMIQLKFKRDVEEVVEDSPSP